MNQSRSLFYFLDQWWQQRKLHVAPDSDKATSTFLWHRHWFLPSPGNVIFTVLVIGSLLWAQNVGAISLGAPAAAIASVTGIPNQGRLADKNGAPLTQTVNMTFRLYAAVSGGAPLWEEGWTGANSVQVSDGLFNVMLGSITPIPQVVLTGNNTLFLGITVGTDSEMVPRLQLGSVPFATQALTVPDGSITTEKLANDLLQIYSASTATEYWSAPQCNGTDIRTTAQWQQISGLTTSFDLDKARKVLLDFSGIGKNPGAGEAIYTNIFVDGNPITVASGAPLLGGCTNSNVSGQPWCTTANSTTATLNTGAHTIDVRAFCDGASADAQIYSGSLRVVVLP
ncbi:MAG: hypothetical protein R3C14_39845 [Caldilineaceae bacterium]